MVSILTKDVLSQNITIYNMPGLTWQGVPVLHRIVCIGSVSKYIGAGDSLMTSSCDRWLSGIKMR